MKKKPNLTALHAATADARSNEPATVERPRAPTPLRRAG
jgi:hypothetical protein